MSHVNVFFAIEAPYGAFFRPVGSETKRVCSVGAFAHQVSDSAKFCEHCGARTVEQPIEEPTEAFKTFCDAREVDPQFAYHQLKEDGWEWSDEVSTKLTIGLYRVQSVDDSERRDPRQIITALGLKIASIHEEHDDKQLSALAFTPEILEKYAAPVREIAEAFKISGTPRLYVQLYVSY